ADHRATGCPAESSRRCVGCWACRTTSGTSLTSAPVTRTAPCPPSASSTTTTCGPATATGRRGVVERRDRRRTLRIRLSCRLARLGRRRGRANPAPRAPRAPARSADPRRLRHQQARLGDGDGRGRPALLARAPNRLAAHPPRRPCLLRLLTARRPCGERGPA